MRLEASNGMAFELDILGYEFPQIETDSWDSNWLMIEVTVTHPDGNWKASDPSLTTFEVKELAYWLENIGEEKKVKSPLDFTEPNLEFHLVESQQEGRILRVCFHLELRPNWQQSTSIDECDLCVEFPLVEINTKAASQELRNKLEAYPSRGS